MASTSAALPSSLRKGQSTSPLIQLRSPQAMGTWSPTPTALGTWASSSSQNNNTLNIPALQATPFRAPDPLGYGPALSFSNVTPVGQASYTPIGSAGAVPVSRVGSFGAVPVERIATPGAVQVERLGRAGAVPVERVQFGNQFKVIDPRTLGLESEWAQDFDLDPRTVEAQYQAMEEMQALIDAEGWDPVSRAAYERAVMEAEVRRQGQAATIQRNAELQGMAGSGMDVMGQLLAGQSSAQDQYLAALDAAALGAQRKDLATQNLATLGLGMREQQFGEAATRATQLDAYERWQTDITLAADEINTGRAWQTEMQNAAYQNQAYAQQYEMQGRYDLANAAAQNAAYQTEYAARIEVAMQNAASQNQAYNIAYQANVSARMADAAAQNNAYNLQYGTQAQYNLANASNRLAADQFNISNQLQTNLANAGFQNQASLMNWQGNRETDMLNAQNTYNSALLSWQNQNDVNRLNTQNAFNAGIINMGAMNEAARYGAALPQQNFLNQLSLQDRKASEARFIPNLLAGRQDPGEPGVLQTVSNTVPTWLPLLMI